ncbi:MAG TPA: hypothetical protein VFD94_06420 [Jatrophihabitans sp.]|nr:hypothetical protein [Jatrophihabitans sp.]
MTEPDPHRTPGVVIAAAAAATVVVPFLIVYAFLFVMRGLFVQVEQPDITATRSGEAMAGFIALAFLILVLWGMLRLLNGSNRSLFWAGQLITAAAAARFLFDPSFGQPQVPAVLLLAALLAIALSCLPGATRWARSGGGERPLADAGRRRRTEPAERPARSVEHQS